MSGVKEHRNHQKRRRKTMKQAKRQLFGNRSTRPCHYCGARLRVETATVDHRQPISKGGYDRRKNFVIACAACNNRKGGMTHAEFLVQQSRK